MLKNGGRITLMPNSHNNLMQMMILLGITLFNVGIIAGVFLNAIPVFPTTQLFVLAAIELPVVLFAYRYGKRNSTQVSL
jgi:hypothetical protein